MVRPQQFGVAPFEAAVIVDRMTDPALGLVLEVEFEDASRVQRIWPSPTIRLPEPG